MIMIRKDNDEEKVVIAEEDDKFRLSRTMSHVKAFIKLVNYTHIMPTRYTLDVDLKDLVDVDVLRACDKKVTAVRRLRLGLRRGSRTAKIAGSSLSLGSKRRMVIEVQYLAREEIEVK
ncbi:large ribosomal subunit protein eL27-like [Lycium barbarum]|uniref:large ribosomal subunit protein eL27-like n=1 Tax=Lycium barbarum TaxID=112863 RepID=UPI00293E8D6F|nr:large ribosomal subunit protein eL27-like [Lycium barbarum]